MSVAPLSGTRVLEFSGQGPVPFCGMMLADLGASVIRIDPLASSDRVRSRNTVLDRGRRSITLDLKEESGRARAMQLVKQSDVLLEGYRPGVMERLGLGPDDCHGTHDRLVYARLTGWGQDGPMAQAAGHDINYIAVTGILGAIGREEPTPPLNIIGDYAGGGSLAAFGVLAALLRDAKGARRQIVDSAMTEGSLYLLSYQYALLARGDWNDERRSNLVDGGHPLFDTYACKDGQYVAVGAVEQKFADTLFDAIGLPHLVGVDVQDTAQFAVLRSSLSDRFSERTRDQWVEATETVLDSCLSPVLSLREAEHHDQISHRGALRTRDGVLEPVPSPRFESSWALPTPAPTPGQHTEDLLDELGERSRPKVSERDV